MISAHDAQEISNLKVFQWLSGLAEEHSAELEYVEKIILSEANKGYYSVHFDLENCPVAIHPILRYEGYRVEPRKWGGKKIRFVVVSWS